MLQMVCTHGVNAPISLLVCTVLFHPGFSERSMGREPMTQDFFMRTVKFTAAQADLSL